MGFPETIPTKAALSAIEVVFFLRSSQVVAVFSRFDKIGLLYSRLSQLRKSLNNSAF